MKKLLYTLLFCWVSTAFAAANTLVIYNGSDYLPKQVITQFTKETGIKASRSSKSAALPDISPACSDARRAHACPTYLALPETATGDEKRNSVKVKQCKELVME